MATGGYLICFLASALMSLLLTRSVRNLAVKHHWVDAPRSARHVHTSPTPRLGGVGIFLSVVAVVSSACGILRWIYGPQSFPISVLAGLLGPACIVFLMGLYDDLHSIGPYWKFGIQAIAATCLYFAGFGIHRFSFFASGEFLGGSIGLPLTILWVLLITNAFNLIDGLDGLAAGSALFATLVVFVVSLAIPNAIVLVSTIALAGAILGFLRFNFYPASMFLGDSGSMFIGFMLSELALAGSQKASTMIAVAIPVVSFGLPLLDVGLSVIRRFLRGKPLFTADREHIHHKLLNRGFSQRKAVLILYVVAAGFALLSLSLLQNHGMIAVVLIVIGIGVWLGVQQLGYSEFSELHSLLQRTKLRREIIRNNIEIRAASTMIAGSRNFSGVCQTLQDSLHLIGFDGFHLASFAPDSFSLSVLRPLSLNANGLFEFAWGITQASRPQWELRLTLVAGDSRQVGTFTLYRAQAHEPLLVDLNLLSGELRNSLSASIERIISESEPTATPRELHEAYVEKVMVAAAR